MIYQINLVVELVIILLLLYEFYDKKFRANVAVLIVLVMDIALMNAVRSGLLPSFCSFCMYPMIVGFCVYTFGWEIRKIVVNNLLWIIFLTGIQVVSGMVAAFTLQKVADQNIQLIVVDVLMVVLYAILRKCVPFKRVAECFVRKELLILNILGIGTSIIVCIVILIKKFNGWYLGEYFALVWAVLTLCYMAVSWEKNKLRAVESEMELQAYQLYEESYQNLIWDIRVKQHDFNNHLNAIYSQHKLCHTYEELVEQQRDYCDALMNDNKYTKLLGMGNSMVAGFLYGKFLEADKIGIEVQYSVVVQELAMKLPLHKLIAIMGNLLNNAMEAVREQQNPVINVSLVESADNIIFVVSNPYDSISVEGFAQMFKKSYSSKGENRGLGLYGIRQMSQEFGLDILCNNELRENINWVEFSIRIPKSKTPL